MIQLKINNSKAEVSKNTTVLEACKGIGIKIPTMCFLSKDSKNHPSCMICVVKDAKNGKLIPSCAYKVEDGMEIITDEEEVFNARKESLELLLSDHVGDCEAPCRPSCPAFMDIPRMNRLIASGKHKEALKKIKEEIALPLILGYICPAPCEKACRRTQIDEAVSICKLKQFAADFDFNTKDIFIPVKEQLKDKKVAIIGTGPAGLACAYYLQSFGYNCILFDKNDEAGGALRYDIPEEKLAREALNNEIKTVKKLGAEFKLGFEVNVGNFKSEIKENFDAVVLATGDYFGSVSESLGFESGKNGIAINKNTYLVSGEGVFACGNIIRSRRMAVNAVAQGKSAAISVKQFLEGKALSGNSKMFNSKFGKLFEEEYTEYMKEASGNSRIDKQKTIIFSKEEAQKEAERCMHCDCRDADDCKLRIYSEEYKANQKRFSFGERKKITKYFRHDLIVFEPEKCIKCNICVEISSKEGTSAGFTVVGRGFNIEINLPYNSDFKIALKETAIECAEKCPTGAIALKIKE